MGFGASHSVTEAQDLVVPIAGVGKKMLKREVKAPALWDGRNCIQILLFHLFCTGHTSILCMYKYSISIILTCLVFLMESDTSDGV